MVPFIEIRKFGQEGEIKSAVWGMLSLKCLLETHLDMTGRYWVCKLEDQARGTDWSTQFRRQAHNLRLTVTLF